MPVHQKNAYDLSTSLAWEFSSQEHREGAPVAPVPRCLWAVHRVR
uniref:Uncharacterized protein n=1 Tax=Klebsiella pneumoniae TaxID=573 RepID=A0A6H0A7W7_KLEPN|nr:hypothetical protein [Klebsiella pneumoniae]